MSIMQSRKVCVIKHGKLYNNTFLLLLITSAMKYSITEIGLKLPDKQYAVAMTAYVT